MDHFSYQIQKILWMIHGCSQQQLTPSPLAESLIEKFLSTIFVENFVADDVIFWISLPEAEIQVNKV